MLFKIFYLIQKNVSVISASKSMNFTDFYDKLLKTLYGCNFTLNLVKKFSQNLRYFCISSFSTDDLKNLRVSNFMQIYLFLLYRSAIYWIRCFEFLSYEL